MMYGNGILGITMGGFSWIFMFLYAAILIIGALYLFKLLTGNTRRELGTERLVDMLKKRYEDGEINREEYEEISRILHKQ